MKETAYYNGKTARLARLRVPATDRAFYFGDGVYDAAYGRNGRIHALDEHIDRFFGSAEAVGITVPESKAGLKEIITRLAVRSPLKDQFVYFQVSRGSGIREHSYPDGVKGNLFVMVKEGKIRNVNLPVKLITVKDTRFLHCNVKSLNLLPSVMAAKAAEREGCDEAVFVRDGAVTECSHSNIFVLKGGRLITAPADNRILAGVCRAHLLRLCEKEGIPAEEREYSEAELYEADEILLTSAGSFCLRASELNKKPVGMKDENLARFLQQALVAEFEKAVNPQQSKV